MTTLHNRTLHNRTLHTRPLGSRALAQRAFRISAAMGLALVALTACTNAVSPSTDTEDGDNAAEAVAAEAITIDDAWVKAAAQGDMTAAFGVLENTTDHDVTLVAAASSATPMIELHETVTDAAGQSTMREVEGGLTIPANGQLHLEPGGNHLMLMGLPQALMPGEEVTFTLTFSDASTLEFTAVVKDYAGANENYESDDSSGSMEHGSMDHDSEDGGH